MFEQEDKEQEKGEQMLSQDGACITKPCTLLDAVEIYRDLVFEERRFLHQAMIGHRPYALAPDFVKFGVEEIEFCAMNITTSSCKIRSFFST